MSRKRQGAKLKKAITALIVVLQTSCVPATKGMNKEDASRVGVEVICSRMVRCGEGRYDFEECIAGNYWPSPAPTMGIPNNLDRCLRFVMEEPCTDAEKQWKTANPELQKESPVYQNCKHLWSKN